MSESREVILREALERARAELELVPTDRQGHIARARFWLSDALAAVVQVPPGEQDQLLEAFEQLQNLVSEWFAGDIPPQITGDHRWGALAGEAPRLQERAPAPAEAALTEFAEWFEDRFPTGQNISTPGVRLYSIYLHARAALAVVGQEPPADTRILREALPPQGQERPQGELREALRRALEEKHTAAALTCSRIGSEPDEPDIGLLDFYEGKREAFKEALAALAGVLQGGPRE